MDTGTFEDFLTTCEQSRGYCRNYDCQHSNMKRQHPAIVYVDPHASICNTYCRDCTQKYWRKHYSPQVVHDRLKGMKPQERQLLLNINRGMKPWVALLQSGNEKQNVYYLYKWTERDWYSYGSNICYGWLNPLGKEMARMVETIVIIDLPAIVVMRHRRTQSERQTSYT